MVLCGRKADSCKKNMRFQKSPDSCGRAKNTNKTIDMYYIICIGLSL